MNLPVNVCLVLLCTTTSGTILVGCWCFIAWIFDRLEKPGGILYTFQVIQVFFLIPFGMLFLILLEKYFRFYHGYLFLASKTMIFACNILAVAWVIGFGIRVGCLARDYLRQNRFNKTLFPCEREQEEVFLRICGKFGIKEGRISLCRSYKAITPFITGAVHPKVVLPVAEYGEQQLEVIFTHELSHFVQGDLWIKGTNNLIACIHFFNPFVYLLKKRIVLWSEFTCDCRSVESLGYVRQYFDTITALMTDDEPDTMQASGLFEGKKELDWRISHMVKHCNGRKISARKAWAMGITTALLSMALVFQTTAYAAELSVDAFVNTQDAQEETAVSSSDVEYTMTGHPDTPGQHMDINPFVRGLSTYSWTVYANSWLDTDSFYVADGGSITISGNLDPTDQTIRVGIINSSGVIRYINATCTFAHTFAITESGNYRIYMENLNSVDVKAAGSYSYN